MPRRSATSAASRTSCPAQQAPFFPVAAPWSYSCSVMPTTSNPAATQSAAVTDESTPPDIATTMRWSEGAPARSMSASGFKTHCPEIGFEPGGGGKGGGQSGEAALAAAPLEL